MFTVGWLFYLLIITVHKLYRTGWLGYIAVSAALNSLSESDMTLNNGAAVGRHTTSDDGATPWCAFRHWTQHANAYLKDNTDVLFPPATSETSATPARSWRHCQPRRLRVRLVATRLWQCSDRRTAVRDHCTTTARPQRCHETCVWPAPTWPCFSGNDRVALAASRGTHTVQAVPPGSSYRHRQRFPTYIADLLQPVSSLTSRGTVLHSPTRSDFQVSRTRLKFGERVFSIAAAKSWNNLPLHVCTADNTDTFKRKLKTFFILHILSATTPNCFYVMVYCITCHWLVSSIYCPILLLLLL